MDKNDNDEIQLDIEKSFKGEIPWNPDEFKQLSEWYHSLVNKPKDDWDLSEKSILIEGDSGEISKLSFNKFNNDNQIAFYMLDNFGPFVFRTQFIRFFKINFFIKRNRDKLEKDKLIIKGKKFDAVSDELLKALCILPFSKIDKRKKNDKFDFNYKEVIKKAKEFTCSENNKEIRRKKK